MTQIKNDRNRPESSDKLCWIFDLDGTLVDTISTMKEFFFEDVPKAFGAPPLNERQKQRMIRRVMDFISGLKISKFKLLREFLWYTRQLGYGPFKSKPIIEYIVKEGKHKLALAPYYPGTIEALNKLINEYKCVVALNTSSSQNEIRAKFAEKMEDLKIFDDLIVSRDDVENRKPDPESIYLISKKSGIPPERCIMVGDMISDIECGYRAGATTIALLCGLLTKEIIESMEIKPDFVFENVAEAVEHFDEIKRMIEEKGKKGNE